MSNFSVLPKCYDDRETFDENASYLFISYAHLDADIVYEGLETLYNSCLNFWYDKKLLQGECWDKSVEDKLRSDNCVGIVMFLSKNSVKSAAVGQELKLYNEIRAKRPNFMLFPVILNGGSVNSTVREAYMSCEGLGTADLDRMMPQERVADFLQTIPSNFFYFRYDAEGRYIDDLLNRFRILEEELIDRALFCSNDRVLAELKRLDLFSEENGINLFEFGKYPQFVDPNANVYKEDVFAIGGKTYTGFKGKEYLHTPIQWRVLKNDSAHFTAITTCAVDAAASSELEQFLKEKFAKSAFSDAERETVVSIDVADMADLKDIVAEGDPVRTAYAKIKNRSGGTLPTYWGKDGDKYLEYFIDSKEIVINDSPGPKEERVAFLQICAVFDVGKFINLMMKNKNK